MEFSIVKKSNYSRARVGVIKTAHGDILTPGFVAVATRATLKGVSPEAAKAEGVQALFANTFHLHLAPGEETIKKAGGLHRFMNWSGPILTDSGGFQVFSLGAGFEQGISKVVTPLEADHASSDSKNFLNPTLSDFVKIDDDGVTFRSPRDGALCRLTPESSIQIQHDLGADIILAFDECTSPTASYEYQRAALARTHAWAKRSLDAHEKLSGAQALFGIVQGGRHQDLREASARFLSTLGVDKFDGFGIGGSFAKNDIDTAVGWTTALLPDNKPRHLLGIGEPEDIVAAVRQGIDTFDCVTPTRLARNGTLLVREVDQSGNHPRIKRLNIFNQSYRQDFTAVDERCDCHTCRHYTRAYLAHLFRAKEMLGATLASVHNLRFFSRLMADIRQAILDDRLDSFDI